MESDNCPMGYKGIDCKDCPDGFSKEGLCDWPYKNPKPVIDLDKLFQEIELMDE